VAPAVNIKALWPMIRPIATDMISRLVDQGIEALQKRNKLEHLRRQALAYVEAAEVDPGDLEPTVWKELLSANVPESQ
jgi:hypothetical protein